MLLLVVIGFGLVVSELRGVEVEEGVCIGFEHLLISGVQLMAPKDSRIDGVAGGGFAEIVEEPRTVVVLNFLLSKERLLLLVSVVELSGPSRKALSVSLYLGLPPLQGVVSPLSLGVAGLPEGLPLVKLLLDLS